MPQIEYAAIVLAGGSGRRVGGSGKPLLRVGGTPMLHRVLAATTGATARVVVGSPVLAASLPPGVTLTREEPPGGGPAAATAAGLGLVPATTHLVAVLAADQPFLTEAAIDRLLRAVRPGVDGAAYTDPERRPQWACSVWRGQALRRRLAELAALPGVSLHRLVRPLPVAEVTWPASTRPPPWYDCDTEEDLARAEEWAHGDAG